MLTALEPLCHSSNRDNLECDGDSPPLRKNWLFGAGVGRAGEVRSERGRTIDRMSERLQYTKRLFDGFGATDETEDTIGVALRAPNRHYWFDQQYE